MSHFTVLVIGDDHEKLLAPFHEFECTGTDDEYVQDIDLTEEARDSYQRFLDREKGEENAVAESFVSFIEDWYGYKPRNPEDEDYHEGDHKYGYVQLDAEGNVAKVIKRTNPNKKWDWYQVGGRWSGQLLLKGEYTEALKHLAALTEKNRPIPDSLLQKVEHIKMGDRSWVNAGQHIEVGRVDRAPKRAIDIERMRDEAAQEAADRYDLALSKLGNLDFLTWREMREKHSDIEQAQAAYHEQPQIIAYNEGRDQMERIFGERADAFRTNSRERYIETAKLGALSAFALLTEERGWEESGSMGMFGVSSDNRDPLDWARHVAKTIDELPEDAVLTMVDCHI